MVYLTGDIHGDVRLALWFMRQHQITADDTLFIRDKIQEINAVEHYILETRLYSIESENRKMEFQFAICGAARLLFNSQSEERIEKAIELIQKVLEIN